VNTMLYTYYGDDFTGSTDVLETLAEAGIPSALFFQPPTEGDLREFPDLQALGIAGDSRSRSPEWMTENLPGIFTALQQFGAPITHYKTCSTFDSASHIGSIGRAIELGIETFEPRFVPIVAAAPHLGRYVVFGQLFATADGVVYRIDRHPTMSRHPVTPMHEADLRRHLAAQTSLPIALLDINHLTPAALENSLTGHRVVLFDALDERSLSELGGLLWHHAGKHAVFAVGSSGITRSLVSAWRSAGLLAASQVAHAVPSTEQLLVVSGSCSPITAAQIEWGLANGFAGITLDPGDLLNRTAAFDPVLNSSLAHLQAGRNLILYSALGPLASSSIPCDAELGSLLGRLLQSLFEQSQLRRAVLCGGDTASHAMQQLDIRALTWLAPVAPGAPLCRAHSPGTRFHHAEFILKGGQMGPPDFFARALGVAS